MDGITGRAGGPELQRGPARAAPDWLRTVKPGPEDAVVLGTHPSGACLWDQVRSRVDSPVTRITVVGPYFDAGLSFLRALRNEHSSAELIAGISPQHSKLDAAVARRLEGVLFRDATAWLGDDSGRLPHAESLHLPRRRSANGDAAVAPP